MVERGTNGQIRTRSNETGNDAAAIVEAKGLKQVTDGGAIEAIADAIIADNPDQGKISLYEIFDLSSKLRNGEYGTGGRQPGRSLGGRR